MTRTTITDVITSRAGSGQLALGLYLVPGFPDWRTSIHAAASAARLGVDFVEFPAICGPTWSSRTGDLIAHALTAALRTPPYDPRWATWLAHLPVRVAVVYESAWPDPAEWRAPEWMRDGAAGLLLEATVAEPAAYASAGEEHGLPMIAVVDATVPALSDAERLALRTGGGFVYAAMGDRTGAGEGRPDPEKIARVRAERPDLPISCAFGVSTADQVREFRRNHALSGVIIGTAALSHLQRGATAFDRWLATIVTAAHQPDSAPEGKVMRS